MAIPPQVLGMVANMAISVGRAMRADEANEARVAGVAVVAAVRAIEACGSEFPSRSPVWLEVTNALGSADSALAVIEQLAQQQPLGVSSEAEPYLRQFAQAFIAGAVAASPTAKVETAAILAAIGLLKAQLLAVTPPVDPLEAIPWHRRPGAPQFRISPGVDGTRFLLEVGLVGGVEPGAIEASWSVNDGPEVSASLMSQPPGRTWSRRAKPVSCEWPAGATEYKVHLRLRFVTSDGEHGYHYWFPLVQHAKGHWILESHRGTTLNNPDPF